MKSFFSGYGWYKIIFLILHNALHLMSHLQMHTALSSRAAHKKSEGVDLLQKG